MISLVVATWNRVAELERLLASLDAQTYKDFELILVDQNPDDRLIHLLRRHPVLNVRHLRSQLGVSRARNVGLRAAQGDIISTPDDDCWYPDDLLAAVTRWFEMHPDTDALFTGMRTADHKLIAPKWAPGPCFCTKKNVLGCVAGVTGFLRRKVVSSVGFFNENIGPGGGSRYGSGEDLDYFIRPLELGFRLRYEPSLTVFHPELQSIERLRLKAYPYALGFGFVLRAHGYSWRDLSAALVRSFAGAAISLSRGDLERTHMYLLRAAGQLQGYILGPRELAKMADSAARGTYTS
jgi:glycosyltransferase involved in cell wall biosynthesis